MVKMKMREVIESGFKITIPEAHSFRFDENPAYQRLSGVDLKEMDIGWWDTAKNKLILIELKGVELWQGFDKDKECAHEFLVKSLKGKVTDVLLMLAAVWIKTGIGKEIGAHLPRSVHQYTGDGNIKLIFLIDTPVSRQPLLLPVKEFINKTMAGRVRLFGVNNISLVNFDMIQKMGLPIERHP